MDWHSTYYISLLLAWSSYIWTHISLYSFSLLLKLLNKTLKIREKLLKLRKYQQHSMAENPSYFLWKHHSEFGNNSRENKWHVTRMLICQYLTGKRLAWKRDHETSQMGSGNNEQKLWCSTTSSAAVRRLDGAGDVPARALFSSYENDRNNTSLSELLWWGLLGEGIWAG